MSASDEERPAPDAEHPNQPAAEPAQAPADPAPQPAPAAPPAPTLTKREEPPPPLEVDSSDVIQLWRLAGFLANSSLLPKELTVLATGQTARNNALLMMLVGKDRGLTPLQALSGGLHIIEGKVEIGAHAMVALVLKSGAAEYLAPVLDQCNELQAVYRTRRRGWPDGHYQEYRFTVDQAAAMGLTTRKNWLRMTPTMLLRRAASGCCREFYPDVVLGLYDHGEVDEGGFSPSPTAQRAEVLAAEAIADLGRMKEAGDQPAKRTDPVADRVKARAKAGRGKGPEADVVTDKGRVIGDCAQCGTPDQELTNGACPACQ